MTAFFAMQTVRRCAKIPSGAKARLILQTLTAGLKSRPFKTRQHPFKTADGEGGRQSVGRGDGQSGAGVSAARP